MRTTLNLDETLIEDARKLTGIDDPTTLVHEGLRALIARENAIRLAGLAGAEPDLRATPPRPRQKPSGGNA